MDNVGYPISQTTVVKNDNGTKLYLNGELVAETSSTELPSDNTFYIGTQWNNNNNEHWNGNIDEVRVWNIALTEAEIQSNYNIWFWNFILKSKFQG